MNFQQSKPSLTDQFNLQTITLWVTEDQFTIQPNYKRSLIPTVLQIDRKSKTIKQTTNPIPPLQSAKPYYFSLLVGIVEVSGIKILVLAQQAKLVCTINYRDIFKITKPIYLFYDSKQKSLLSEQDARLLINITSVLEQGMFFSLVYDLTMVLNSASSDTSRKQQFNWAKFLQKELKPFDPYWSIPVILGFVGKIQIHLSGQKFTIALISRRSTFRSGIREFGRGIDTDGNVGNFVETEQVISIDQYMFSFIQVRGSVPLFWQVQDHYGGMVKNINLQRSLQDNQQAFLQHFSLIRNNFKCKSVCILNLLSQKKYQKKLVQNYQYLVRKWISENNRKEGDKDDEHSETLHYAYFDVHSQCPSKDYTKLNQFLQNNLLSNIQDCDFTAIRVVSKSQFEVLNQQKGVIRTNCMDCIDRSNIAQFRIATLSMIYSLKHLHTLKEQKKSNNKEIQVRTEQVQGAKIEDSQLSEPFDYGFINSLKFIKDMSNPFTILYRGIWADNGDYLSKQYTGTGSTQSFAIRKGKLSYLTSIDHGMKSLERALINFRNQNQDKNYTIQFMLGLARHSSSHGN